PVQKIRSMRPATIRNGSANTVPTASTVQLKMPEQPTPEDSVVVLVTLCPPGVSVTTVSPPVSSSVTTVVVLLHASSETTEQTSNAEKTKDFMIDSPESVCAGQQYASRHSAAETERTQARRSPS